MQYQPTVRYYLFSFANLLAAFGGGMILGKGVGIIQNGYFQGDSILAFFIGTVLGLIFLQLVPKKWAKTAGQCFAICGAVSSLVLLFIFEKFSINGKLENLSASIFFILLSIRFGFWFYSRVLRASEASGYKRNIAWVELGYYTGIIIGLIIWTFLDVQINFAFALLLDVIFQFFAGILDYLCATKSHLNPSQELNLESSDNISLQQKLQTYKSWCWRLALAVMFLTIGIQVVTFNLAHQAPEYTGSYILAIFYLGVALAAYLYNKLKVSLSWDNKNGYARIYFNKIKVSVVIINLVSAIAIIAAVIYFYGKNNILLLLFIFIAAFFYEIFALSILDRIGLEEKSINYKGMVIRAYGLMALGAVIGLWILNIAHNSLVNLLILMISSLVLSSIIILKRKEA